MKSKIAQVLDRYLNGRRVAVWGNPARHMLKALKGYEYSFAGTVDPANDYVVAVTEEDLDDFMDDEQGKSFRHAEDCHVLCEYNTSLPFDWECHGVKIGKFSYFGERYAEGCQYGYIGSIGRFTSINKTAMIQVDHQLNMVFTSDDIQEIFTDGNQALFNNKINVDPKSPYCSADRRVAIGNDVYISANSYVNASKVRSIGDGAIIGAGAVVLADVPPYAVAVGVPAKIKRYRFQPAMIETLLRVKWWDWSFDEINANADALMSPDLFMERFGASML